MNLDFLTLELALFAATLVFAILASSIVVFVFFYKKKQKSHKLEKSLIKKGFESQILQTKLEITEQNLIHLSQEIHDNLGQKISFVIKNGSRLLGEDHFLIRDVHSILNELRNLSRTMNGDFINRMGLDLAIEQDCKRLKLATEFQCEYKSTDEYLGLNDNQEIILYRCFQELMNNSIKHSKGSMINVSLLKEQSGIVLKVKDNGVGFVEKSQSQLGLGLLNLRNRVKLLSGELEINEGNTSGSKTKIFIPLNNVQHD